MKKSTVVFLIMAFSLIFTGIGMLVYAFTATDFNIDAIKDRMYAKEIQNIQGDFDSIEVKEAFFDIEIRITDKEQSYFEYSKIEGIEINSQLNGKALEFSFADNRKWYNHIGFIWHNDPHFTLYLSQKDYDTLKISGHSSDVWVSNEVSLKNTDINITSGDIKYYASTSDNAFIKTISGDINVEGINSAVIVLESTSGDILVTDCNLTELRATATSGDIDVGNTEASQEIELSTVSGDVEFWGIDSKKINLNATSGDIEGSVKTPKKFSAESTSGDVYIPNSTSSNSTLNAKTTSGDIHITIGEFVISRDF